jgi:hypothetical protein
MENNPLFQRAVEMWRLKRYTSLEIANDLGGMIGANSVNVHHVVAEAHSYVVAYEKKCLESCTQFFRKNGTDPSVWVEARKKLVSLGIHPFDAEQIATRTQTLVAKEKENGVNSR